MPTPAPIQPRPRPWPLLAFALFLSVFTTLANPLASAFLQTACYASRGVVERDGDHLQLWVLQADSFSFTRSIWFEKGRIYNKTGVGPAGGSSAAVACWSFATGTRTFKSFVKGVVDMPDDQRRRVDDTPQSIWGLAIDRRGWPFRALEGRAVGTMNAASPDPYVAEVGILIPATASLPGIAGTPAAFRSSDSLADLRILPTRPLWRGLIADTLFFAAAWWVALRLLAAARTALITRRRNRRGLCQHCGYDLTGLPGPTCPECGRTRGG